MKKLKVLHQQLQDERFVRKRGIFTFCENERKEKLKVLHQQLQDKWFVERGRYLPFVKRNEKLKVLHQQLQDKRFVRKGDIYLL